MKEVGTTKKTKTYLFKKQKTGLVSRAAPVKGEATIVGEFLLYPSKDYDGYLALYV